MPTITLKQIEGKSVRGDCVSVCLYMGVWGSNHQVEEITALLTKMKIIVPERPHTPLTDMLVAYVDFAASHNWSKKLKDVMPKGACFCSIPMAFDKEMTSSKTAAITALRKHIAMLQAKGHVECEQAVAELCVKIGNLTGFDFRDGKLCAGVESSK
jgi:hypothetical protein